MPAVRAQAGVTFPLSPSIDFVARLDVASLLLGLGQVGFRNGDPNAGVADTTWVNLGVGVQFKVL